MKTTQTKMTVAANTLLDQMISVSQQLRRNRFELGRLACEFEDKGLYRYASGTFSSFRLWMLHVGEILLGVSWDTMKTYMDAYRLHKMDGVPADLAAKVPLELVTRIRKLPGAQRQKTVESLASGEVTVKALLTPPPNGEFRYLVQTERDRQAVIEGLAKIRRVLFANDVRVSGNQLFISAMRFVLTNLEEK